MALLQRLRIGIPILIRLGTALVSLVTLRLTYSYLDASEFALFNSLLLAIAIGTAMTAPVNRLFWASNSRDNFAYTVAVCSSVCLLSIMFLLFVLGNAKELATVSAVALALSASAYGVARTVERYIYGQLFFEYNITRALLVPATFILIELAVLYCLVLGGRDGLVSRLAVPTAVFVCVIFVQSLPRDILLSFLDHSLRSPQRLLQFASGFWNLQSLFFIVFYVSATFAAMGERLAITALPESSNNATSDYLLAVAYSIAWLTLLTTLFDVARKSVFQDGSWQPGARIVVIKLIGFVVVFSIAAWVIHPVLQALNILPYSISIFLWGGLLFKSSVLVCVQISFVDRIQSGDVWQATIAMLTIAVAAVISSGVYVQHQGQYASALVVSIPTLTVLIYSMWALFLRMPVLAESK